MERFALNEAIFAVVNAAPAPDGIWLAVAQLASSWTAIGMMIAASLAWLVLRDRGLRNAVGVLVAIALAAGIAELVANIFPEQRPFVVGFGTLLTHQNPTASFPSGHATVVWATALMLLTRPGHFGIGIVYALLAALTSWSRLYLGVHWPLDIVGGFAVGLIASMIASPFFEAPAQPRKSRYRVWNLN